LAPDDALPAPEDLTAVYSQFVARAHLHGIRVLGGTLLPFEGALHDTPQRNYWTPAKEKLRQAVNQWIRTSGVFDGIIDFDAALRDPAHPGRLSPAYDAGDHLHPNDAGDKALAEAVDLEKLR
jgi:lysophospholipase L1-like esterase